MGEIPKQAVSPSAMAVNLGDSRARGKNKRDLTMAVDGGAPEAAAKRSRLQPEEASKLLAEAFNASATGAETLSRMEHIARIIKPSEVSAAESEPDLALWISSLSRYVSKMHSSANALVEAVLAIDWCSMDNDFILEYHLLLENLVSANAQFVHPILKMLVRSFRSAYRPSAPPAELARKFDHIHKILSVILRLVPSAPSLVVPIVVDNFPHKSEDVEDNVWYLKNTMRLSNYAPILKKPLWILAVDKLVQIDVEIQTTLDELGEDEYDSVLQHCFDLDGVDLDSPTLLASPNSFVKSGKAEPERLCLPEGELSMNDLYENDYGESDGESSVGSLDLGSDDDDVTEVAPIVSDFRIMAGKLDSMLQYLMLQIEDIHKSDSVISDDFFGILLDSFCRTVLPTHKCRYTQFLFFKACSLNANWCEQFLVVLAQKSFDSSTPSIIRVSAVAYLGSFICRASFLNSDSLLQCLKLLHSWALQYVESNETVNTVPDLKRDHVFYAVIQSVLYIFCFRWQEIVGPKTTSSSAITHGQLPVEMDGLQRIILSKFAPLQVCTRSIVSEFARITHKLDILYCYGLMKRNGDAASVENGKQKPENNQPHNDAIQPSLYTITETLEAFFPFDPCNLQMSRKLIAASYAEWKDEDDGASTGSFEAEISESLSTSLDHILHFSSPRLGEVGFF